MLKTSLSVLCSLVHVCGVQGFDDISRVEEVELLVMPDEMVDGGCIIFLHRKSISIF